MRVRIYDSSVILVRREVRFRKPYYSFNCKGLPVSSKYLNWCGERDSIMKQLKIW